MTPVDERNLERALDRDAERAEHDAERGMDQLDRESVRCAADHIDEAWSDALLAETPDAVAAQLALLDDIGRHLRDRRAAVEEHLVAVMDGHETAALVLSDGTRVERHRKSSRKGWDHEGAASAVLRYVPAATRELNPQTGAVESDAEVAVRLVRECASISSWKKRLTEITGTSMDEWCSESWSDSVKLTRPKR